MCALRLQTARKVLKLSAAIKAECSGKLTATATATLGLSSNATKAVNAHWVRGSAMSHCGSVLEKTFTIYRTTKKRVFIRFTRCDMRL